MSGEQLHNLLDNIEEIHGLYSPIALVSLPLLPAEDLPFCLAADRLKCFVLLSELVSETF